jgi:hypothetical protein
MGAGTDLQIVLGLRKYELFEKEPAHVKVVMLSGMDDNLSDRRIRLEIRCPIFNGTADRRCLDELGSCTEYGYYSNQAKNPLRAES